MTTDTPAVQSNPRVFAYCRVSTLDQTTENQVQEIKAAGFNIPDHRIINESVSGSVATSQRKGFNELLIKMESGDVLIVTKLDRLGRNAMDVKATVDDLGARGIKVHCLALGGMDLTSPAGKMTMQVINAVAEFERDLIIERTQSGLQRANAEGRHGGRPESLTKEQQQAVMQKLKEKSPNISTLAREFGTTRQTILRTKAKMDKENKQ